MWVRSQDFTKLANVEHFSIHDLKDGWYEVWGNNPGRSYVSLGVYMDAKSVLDDIQYAIAHGIKVFNMPEREN